MTCIGITARSPQDALQEAPKSAGALIFTHLK
jgi:hypothetical protein